MDNVKVVNCSFSQKYVCMVSYPNIYLHLLCMVLMRRSLIILMHVLYFINR